MTSELQSSDYERAFRSLLWRLRPCRVQRGIELLMHRAVENSADDQTLLESLRRAYSRTRNQAIRHLLRRREMRRASPTDPRWSPDSRSAQQTRSVLEEGIPTVPIAGSADFHCDSGLGGLARWLRAAGYDARFWPYIDDSELIRETLAGSAILLTTDEPLMLRSAVAWGVVPALLVPLNVGKISQFEYVARRLELPCQRPRCMSCGGQLASIDKESVRDRIPPRTYPWLDDYYQCLRCGQLFWPGTHWQRVTRRLETGNRKRETGGQ